MSRNKISVIAALLFVGVAVVVVTCYYYLLSGPGMLLPFTLVDSFTRSDEFIASFPHNKQIKADVLGQPSPAFYDADDSTRWTVAVRPDAKGYYVCRTTSLGEYNPSGKTTRELKLADFGLKTPEHMFMKIEGIATDRLWVRVGCRDSEEPGVYRTCGTLEWLFCDPPEKATLQDMRCSFMAVNARDSLIYMGDFVTGPIVRVYDFKEHRILNEYAVKGAYAHFHYADFQNGSGLVLSTGFWDQEATTTIFDPCSGSFNKTFKGINAWWGSDGYVYFLRGQTQLWRFVPTNGKMEPVFLFTRAPRGRNGQMQSLWVGADRAFMVYNYEVPLPTGGSKVGAVLIDLERKEYKVVRKGIIGTF